MNHIVFCTYLTHDMLGSRIFYQKFKLPSANSLAKNVFRRFFIKCDLNNLINYKAVCKTAPATPDLLIRLLTQCNALTIRPGNHLYVCMCVGHTLETTLPEGLETSGRRAYR